MNSLVKPLGYEFRKSGSDLATKDGLQLYSYARADGTFDYDKYREAQIAGNYKKLDNVWVREILDAPSKKNSLRYLKYIVIQRS